MVRINLRPKQQQNLPGKFKQFLYSIKFLINVNIQTLHEENKKKNTRLHRYVTVGKTTDMIKFVMEGILSLASLTAWSGAEHSHCGHFC